MKEQDPKELSVACCCEGAKTSTMYVIQFILLVNPLSLSKNISSRRTRTKYDPDLSLIGNAKICCLGLILALL